MKKSIICSSKLSEQRHHDAEVPSDKSITQRSILVAALFPNVTTIELPNLSNSILPLISALQKLGVEISVSDGKLLVGFLKVRDAEEVVTMNLGSSSAACRFLVGIVSGLGIPAIIDGDDSLRPRPVNWVVDPLRELGASITYLVREGELPIRIDRSQLKSGVVSIEVGSAQATSCMLLAAFAAQIKIQINQSVKSRDHTQRLLRHIGANVSEIETGLVYTPGNFKRYNYYKIPKDPSAVAYIVAGYILQERKTVLRISDVCLNPTRIGFFNVLRVAGANIVYENFKDNFGEPVGDLILYPFSILNGLIVSDEFTFHSMIDEIPLAAAIASQINGLSQFYYLKELEFKETNRIFSTQQMLKSFGVNVVVDNDSMQIQGKQSVKYANDIPCFGDHRIAMTATLLGCLSRQETRIVDGNCFDTSFPFFDLVMQNYGFDVRI